MSSQDGLRPASPPSTPILYKPEPDDEHLRSHLRRPLRRPLDGTLPFNHPRAACWIKRAGDRYKLSICTYEVPGGLRSHREQIARELTAIYRPSCNPDQYDNAWKDEWIGEYSAPTAGPLTTGRDPATGQGR